MMFWAFLIIRSLLATFAGLIASFAFGRNRSPRLAYNTWLGMMVMLLFPPLVYVPIWSQQSTQLQSTQLQSTQLQSNQLQSNQLQSNQLQSNQLQSNQLPPHSDIAREVAGVEKSLSPPLLSIENQGQNNRSSVSFSTASSTNRQSTRGEHLSAFWDDLLPFLPRALFAAWVVGAIWFTTRYAWQRRSVIKLLRWSTPVPASVQQVYVTTAKELGVAKPPELFMICGSVSPFLWHPIFGQARIVLPQKLTEGFSSQSLDIVFKHELTHYLRRDSYRRSLEMIATSLWWWLPVAWIARRRLNFLEELLTDQRVIRSCNLSPASYATALLDVEEALAGHGNQTISIAPSFTNFQSLRSRIEWITHPEKSRFPNRCFVCLAICTWVLLLPAGLVAGKVVSPSASASHSIGVTSQDLGDTDETPAERENTAERSRQTVRPKKPIAANEPPAPKLQNKPPAASTKRSLSRRHRKNRLKNDVASAGNSVHVIPSSDGIDITLVTNGISRTAKIQRMNDVGGEATVWNLIEYDNPATEKQDDHYQWLFSGLALRSILKDGEKLITHCDLPLLEQLLQNAADGKNLDELLDEAKGLVSNDARGRFGCVIAANWELNRDQRSALIQLLRRNDYPVAFSVENVSSTTNQAFQILKKSL